ncbi:MAG: glycosyltransferase family 4 protein [Fulvivirga sp.]|uniref:glycosyltransferase family 4 protein n=1 Tax=Fulvivirga sp. TaxID=1931237 RepID=UPI0032EE6AF0
MKIIKLASLHVPFDTRIFQKEAKSLVKAGHDVSIIVPHKTNETVDDIKIISVPIPKSGKDRLIKTNYQIFKKAYKQDKNSIIHFHDSELIVYAIILSLLGRTVIYDAHEDTPRQTMYQHWIPKLLRRPVALFYYILEKIGGYLFKAVIIAEPIIGSYFPKKKTWLIRNFVKINEQSIDQIIPYGERENIITYIGGITEARGALTMINALAKVKNTNFSFALGGTFHPPALKEKLQKIEGWNKVEYHGWVNRREVYEILNKSRIGIIIPKPNSRYSTNYPVKLFEYMEAGIPVIASSEGVSKKFVEESQCGILVDPLNIDEIATAIDYLLNNPDVASDMGIRGRWLIKNKYNWCSEEKKLLQLYSSLGN